MITTSDAALAERISLLRSHGGVRTGAWFSYEEAGFNYRMSDIQGAMGIAQMQKLPHLIERKRLLAEGLRSRLAGLEAVKPPCDPPWGNHIYQSFVVLLAGRLDRDAIVQRMRERGIETTLGTYAVHDQPFYQRTYGYVRGQLRNSHTAFTKSLTLPLYPQMKEGDLDFIAENLREVIASAESHA
jgi:dTDP-4-amino-4,6-dideoxygalactose transaminase